MWCIAELDDEYIEKMEDVLAVYEKPLAVNEPVVCVDEKSVTLHKDVREPLPMKPGSVVEPPMSSVESSRKRECTSRR